mgnify:CR=1 FL=1
MCKINLLLIIMSYLKIFFLMLCMILVSCTGQKTGKENDNNDKIAIEVGEIKFPPQDVLQLKSYYLSSSVHVDSIDYLIGYNYRLHSLDCMNLKSKSVTQIVLPGDGPDAIVRLSGIYAQSLDSVWISDESERAFLIDSVGTIKRMIDLKKISIEGQYFDILCSLNLLENDNNYKSDQVDNFNTSLIDTIFFSLKLSQSVFLIFLLGNIYSV